MLRRYSSRNLETIPIQSKVLTIGTDKCDLKINAKGVHPIHASIEQNPASGTFWLRDHSLAGHTSVNGHTVNGQVELHNGDLVRIGRAQPYVFEKRTLLPLMNGNTTNEELVGNGSVGETALPILGKRISPLPPQSRSAARRPVTAVAKSRRSASSAPKATGRTKGAVVREEVQITSPPSSIDTVSDSSTRSGLKQTIHTRGSVGNHLLQRVIRLQDEVARKNAEIDELRRRQCSSCLDVPPSPRRHSYFEQNANLKKNPISSLYTDQKAHDLRDTGTANAGRTRFNSSYTARGDELVCMSQTRIAAQSGHRAVFVLQTWHFTRSPLPPVGNMYSAKNFELEAYRAFLGTVAAKVRSFNNYILGSRSASYSDVFSTFFHVINEPISDQMLEIERECDIELERKGFSALQRTQLADFFRNDRRESISSIAGEIEQLVPVIRDACATAGESIRVCNVFTQWSRQLGDQIRVSGLTGNQLLQAIDELKKDFSRNRMEDHWLIPSISPLLALTAQELEKSRETSSIGDTQTGSADDSFSKVLQLEHVMKSAADKNDRNSGNSKRTSADSLDHILLDVEEKSVQLESQLSLLERKISQSKDINASTRERINQLLLRLNTSSCLVQRTCNGESDNDRKESSTSVLSFEITENDIDRARQIKEDKLKKEPSLASVQDVVEVEKRTAEAVREAPKTVLSETMQSSREDAEVNVNDAHEENVEEVFQKADAGVTEMANVSEDVHAVSQESTHNEDSTEEQVGSETKGEASTECNGEEKEAYIEQHIEEEGDNFSQHSFTTNNSLPESENQRNEVENQQNSEDHAGVLKENRTAVPLEEENENDGQEEKREKHDLEEPSHDANEIGDSKTAVLSEGNENNKQLECDAEENKKEGKENGSNVPSEGEEEGEKVQLKEIAEDTQENNRENDVNDTAEQSESQEQSEGEENATGDTGQQDQQTRQNGLNSILEVTENDKQSPRDNLEANLMHQEEDSLMNTPGEKEDQPQSKGGEPAEENLEPTQVKTVENESGETEKKDENNLGDLEDDTNNNLDNGVEEASNQGEQGVEQNNGAALESPSSGNALAENRTEENTDVAQNTSADIIPNKNSSFAQPGDSPIIDENNGSIDSPCSILSKNEELNHLQNLGYEINNDGTAVVHDRIADNERDTSRNAFLSPQQSETLSSLGKIGALPEFELTHKYHIQSHINTATRVPVISQPVPLQKQKFRSPKSKKKLLTESGKDTKPPLYQPRFVF